MASTKHKTDEHVESKEAAESTASIKPLARIAEDALLDKLRNSLSANARNATFACGGEVPFQEEKNEDHELAKGDTDAASTETHHIKPIQLRYSASGKGANVIFPLTAKRSDAKLKRLISACQPASFGRRGEDIVDESYRKACKLDESDFATSFCPYTRPGSWTSSRSFCWRDSTRRITAAASKQSFTSSTSTLLQAASSRLTLMHRGASSRSAVSSSRSLSTTKAGSSQFVTPARRLSSTGPRAAILPPKAPHANPASSGQRSTADVQQSRYADLQSLRHARRWQPCGSHYHPRPGRVAAIRCAQTALQTPGFLMHGRVLALYLAHSYAHTHKSLNFLPSSLKGGDWAPYETARALGLKCELVSAYKMDEWDEDASEDENEVREYADSSFPQFINCYSQNEVKHQSRKHEVPTGRVTWLTKEDKGYYSRLPAGTEPQYSYTTYGNEASTSIMYSQAAILIRIPPFGLRGNEDVASKSIFANVKEDKVESKSKGDKRYY